MAHTQTKTDLIEKARQLDSASGALISLKDLYSKVAIESGMSKEAFDRQVLSLADKGLVWLHSHALPAMSKEYEVVWDKDDCYMGLVIR